MNGLKMRYAGKLTHEQLAAGLKKMFESELMNLLSAWIKGELFISQRFKNLDQFLTIDERDYKQDYARWCDFEGTSDITEQKGSADFAEVKKFADKWVRKSMDYRRQFLDEQGRPMTRFDEKELQQEYERLKSRFW